jgi:Tol biopolymer transport system component
MIDEREQFGRVVRGFAPPNDAFERFVDRKGRKQRNRRIRAGALGVIVALAAGILFVRSLTSDSVPANQPIEPAPAPLSGAIAYDLRGQIHVAGLDGSNPVAIEDVVTVDDECSGTVYTMHPSWSPDGRYLAFNRTCDDPGLIEVVIADLHGNVVQTIRVAQAYPQEAIAWSPDSTRVAVWDEYHWREGTYTIGVHGIDGSRETFAMPPGYAPSPQNGGPIWAPDGASLIVSELEVPLDGGTPREVPFLRGYMDRSGGGWTGGLAYSSDGSQVAYGTPEGLMVARADGSDPRAVSDDGAHSAAWSPNGELIAVASNGDGAGNVVHPENYNGEWLTEQSPNRLRVVDVATGSTTLLSEGAWFEVIGFSPEGDRVLFGEQRDVVGQPGTVIYSIWSIGVDGSDARQIVVGTNHGAVRPT